MNWWQRNRFVVFVGVGATPASIAWLWPQWWLGLASTVITVAIMFAWDAWVTH